MLVTAREDGSEVVTSFSPSAVSPSPPIESVPTPSKEGGSGLVASDFSNCFSNKGVYYLLGRFVGLSKESREKFEYCRS